MVKTKKSPKKSSPKRKIKFITVKSSPPKGAMTVSENLEKLGLPALNQMLENYGIQNAVVGSGKNGRILKGDIITAIKVYLGKNHGGKPITISVTIS